MNKEDKMRFAIGEIDDKLVEGAREVKTKKPTKYSWLKWGSVAAAFILVAALGVFVLPGMLKGNDPVTPDTSDDPGISDIIYFHYDRLYAVDFYVGSDNACIVKLIDFTETERKEENGKIIRRGISTFQVKYVLKGNHRVDEIIQTEDIKNVPERAIQFLGNNYMKAEHDSYHVEIYSAEIGKYYYYFDTPETVTNDETQFKYNVDQMLSAVSMELPAALKFSDEDEQACMEMLYGVEYLKLGHEAKKRGYSSLSDIMDYQFHDIFLDEVSNLYGWAYCDPEELNDLNTEDVGTVFLGIPLKSDSVGSKTINGVKRSAWRYRVEVVQPIMNYGNLKKGDIIEFYSHVDYYGDLDYYDNPYEIHYFDEETADRYEKSSPLVMVAYDYFEYKVAGSRQ